MEENILTIKTMLKKYKKYIIWIIILLATIWVLNIEQKDSILKVVESFTSTWVTQ